MQIITGKVKRPLKIVVYGQEGVGKTTLASQFPRPIFLDFEAGTSHIDVTRLFPPANWQELFDAFDFLEMQSDYDTIVLDPIDVCMLTIGTDEVFARIPSPSGTATSIEDYGYGKGYTYLSEYLGRLLARLDKLMGRSGKHVLILAHGGIERHELPEEQGGYDRWQIRMHKKGAALLKEWSDACLFAAYKTVVQKDKQGKGHASGKMRVLRTEHNATWDAKNRFGLASEIPLDFSSIAHLFQDEQSQTTTKSDIERLLSDSGLSAVEIIPFIAAKGYCSLDDNLFDLPEKFLRDKVIPYFEILKQKAIEARKETVS